MSWSTESVSLKLWVGFSIFDSVSFLLKFLFLFDRTHGLLTLKRHNSKIKTKEKLHTNFFLDLWLQQEVLKFNNICVNLISPKTELVKNF